MKHILRFGTGLVLGLLSTSWAGATPPELKRAREFYERGQYTEAQGALQSVNRAALNDSERTVFDRLTADLQAAAPGAGRAAADLARGDRAFDERRWDDAESAYRAVAANRHASEEQLGRARAQRQRLADRDRLAQAVGGRPAGAVPVAYQTDSVATPAQEITEGPSRLTPVDWLKQRDELLWQRAVAQLEEAARMARQAVDEERFDDARQLADQAIQVVEAARGYAEPPSRYEAARESALLLRDEIAALVDMAMQEKTTAARSEIEQRIADRKLEQERLRLEKIEQLFGTAGQLYKERRFAEAAEAIRQVMSIDPSNSRARLLLDMFEDRASLDAQAALNATLGRQQRSAIADAREALVPWHQDILYPKNWVEISARRRGIEKGFGMGDEDNELNRLLDKEKGMPEFNFTDTPLDQVADFLSEYHKVNLNIDWDDLNNNGVERDKPVSIKLKDVTFRTALKELLSQVGGETPLAFTIGEGLIRIATKEKLDRDKFILVYDIRDLLVNVPRFVGPEVDLQQQQQLGGQGGGGGGQGIFGGGQGGQNNQGEQGQEGANQGLIDQIMDIIRQTVEPDSWRESGGGNGALRELNGQLIVYNTSDAQRQVSNLLAQLRETRALQIAVESRFLIVTANFLQEIGVDIDFVLNQGSAPFDQAFNAQGVGIRDNATGAPVLLPRRFSRAGVLPAVPGIGGGQLGSVVPTSPYGHPGLIPSGTGISPHFNNTTPIPIQNNTLSLVNPSGINTGVPNSLADEVISPAFSIAGSFLDNLQVDFLIRATEANRRSSVVQAPRLLMFNGQRAFVAIQRQRQYVSSLTPVVAEAAVAVQPVIGQVASGTVLDVEGTISADRRYVTLTVRTSMSEDPTFERFEIQGRSGSSPSLFVLLPDQQIRTINTTVSVPDGGTVLLGGLKQVGEVEVEAGVPILSKIPVLKRAFTNATTVKDSQTLLILLKTKILIQKEAEDDVFPGLSSIES